MDFGKIRNRDDVRWAHPELEVAYSMMNSSTGGAMGSMIDKLLDPKIPLEVRQGIVAKYEEGFAQRSKPYDWSRTTEYEVPGCEDEPDATVKILVSKPKEPRYKKKSPCIFIIPGGGMASCFMFTAAVEEFADAYGVTAVTFKYRTISDGAVFPAAINDCEAAYNYVAQHAEELGINADKIVLYGNSTGGHLALALSHRLKRRGITPRGCLVWVPIIDDRPMPQYRSAGLESAFWGGTIAAKSATQYLGELANSCDVPGEAFPGRATVEECVGLPPTFIHAMMNDSGLDQAFEYASKLNAAGVYAEVHAWGGSQHASLTMSATIDVNDPDAEYAHLFNAVCAKEFKDMFTHDLRRPWVAEELGE